MRKHNKLKRRKTDEHSDENRWLISYADFLSLMFSFFVVMYALSNVNVHKYRAFADSAQAAFSKSDVNKIAKRSSGAGIVEQKSKTPNDNDPNANAERVDMKIEFTSFFQLGSATLTHEATQVLSELAAKLKDKPVLVTVEGHTDNKPITNSYFKSNWELSATRAAAVANYLSHAGLNPQRLSAIGYGEEFPVADNLTVEGRLKNRRVVLVISPNQYRTRAYLSPKQQAEALLAKPQEAPHD